MNDDKQEESQLALLQRVYRDLIELKTRAEAQMTTANRMVEAIKWSWKKLSDELRLGIEELTDEIIKERYDTYNEDLERRENERIEQIRRNMASGSTLEQWTYKDEIALEPSVSFNLPRNIQFIVDAGECIVQRELTEGILPVIDGYITNFHDVLTKVEKLGASTFQIVATSEDDDGSQAQPFESSEHFQEVEEIIEGAREALDDREHFLTSPHRRTQLEQFERALHNSLQQIVGVQAREIQSRVIANERALAHLYDENALRQSLGSSAGLDRIEALLRDRAKRFSERDQELLQAQWGARLWGGIAHSFSTEAKGAEDSLLISTRSKSLFAIANENKPWPPSWQEEAMVMVTSPEGYQLPDATLGDVFLRSKEDSALQAYQSLLQIRQKHIASKTNNEDQQWVEDQLHTVWSQLGAPVQQQIVRWATQTTPGKDVAIALQHLQNHPVFPQVLRVYEKWNKETALLPEDVESMQHDFEVLEQQLRSRPSSAQALEQLSEKFRQHSKEMQELIDSIPLSDGASELSTLEVLENILRVSGQLRDAEGRIVAIKAKILSFNKTSAPRNSQEMEDRFLDLLKVDRRMLDESETVFFIWLKSDLRDLPSLLRLFETAYKQKEKIGEIQLILEYFEKEGVDVQDDKAVYRQLRDKIIQGMSRRTRAGYEIFKLSADPSLWTSHMADLDKLSREIGELRNSLAMKVDAMGLDGAKSNKFISELLTQKRHEVEEIWNRTQSPEHLKALREQQTWLECERLMPLPVRTSDRIERIYAQVLFQIGEYARFEKLHNAIKDFVLQEDSFDRGRLEKGGELLEKLDSLNVLDRDVLCQNTRKEFEELKAERAWPNKQAEYQAWIEENVTKINQLLNILSGGDHGKLRYLAKRLDNFRDSIGIECFRAGGIPRKEAQIGIDKTFRELKRQIAAYSQPMDEPEDLSDQEKFILAVVGQMDRDLIHDARDPFSTATLDQDAMTRWRTQYKPAVTDVYIAKKAKPDVWSRKPLSALRSEHTKQDKAAKRVAFISLLESSDHAPEDSTTAPQARTGEDGNELSGQITGKTAPAHEPGNELEKRLDHSADTSEFSNKQKREYLEEFSIVLQAALSAARRLAPPDTRLHRTDVYADRTKFNFFIAGECCKELIRSEDLNNFFTRWATAKEHGDSLIEKMVIAASAVVNIIDVLKKTKQDTIRTTIKTLSNLMLGIPSSSDKHTLHPSIRAQLRSLNTDFINAVPPAGLRWGIPEHVIDLTKLQNVTLTRCLVPSFFTIQLAREFRSKKEVWPHLMEASRMLERGDMDSGPVDEAASACELAKEHLFNAINIEKISRRKKADDKSEGKDEFEADRSHAYIDYEAWDDDGHRHYYRVPLAVLLQQEAAEEINSNFSHSMLQKTIFAAVYPYALPRFSRWDSSYEAKQRLWISINQEYRTEGLINEHRVIDLEQLRSRQFIKGPISNALNHQTDTAIVAGSSTTVPASKPLDQQNQEATSPNRKKPGHDETEKKEAVIETAGANNKFFRHEQKHGLNCLWFSFLHSLNPETERRLTSEHKLDLSEKAWDQFLRDRSAHAVEVLCKSIGKETVTATELRQALAQRRSNDEEQFTPEVLFNLSKLEKWMRSNKKTSFDPHNESDNGRFLSTLDPGAEIEDIIHWIRFPKHLQALQSVLNVDNLAETLHEPASLDLDKEPYLAELLDQRRGKDAAMILLDSNAASYTDYLGQTRLGHFCTARWQETDDLNDKTCIIVDNLKGEAKVLPSSHLQGKHVTVFLFNSPNDPLVPYLILDKQPENVPVKRIANLLTEVLGVPVNPVSLLQKATTNSKKGEMLVDSLRYLKAQHQKLEKVDVIGEVESFAIDNKAGACNEGEAEKLIRALDASPDHVQILTNLPRPPYSAVVARNDNGEWLMQGESGLQEIKQLFSKWITEQSAHPEASRLHFHEVQLVRISGIERPLSIQQPEQLSRLNTVDRRIDDTHSPVPLLWLSIAPELFVTKNLAEEDRQLISRQFNGEELTPRRLPYDKTSIFRATPFLITKNGTVLFSQEKEPRLQEISIAQLEMEGKTEENISKMIEMKRSMFFVAKALTNERITYWRSKCNALEFEKQNRETVSPTPEQWRSVGNLATSDEAAIRLKCEERVVVPIEAPADKATEIKGVPFLITTTGDVLYRQDQNMIDDGSPEIVRVPIKRLAAFTDRGAVNDILRRIERRQAVRFSLPPIDERFLKTKRTTDLGQSPGQGSSGR